MWIRWVVWAALFAIVLAPRTPAADRAGRLASAVDPRRWGPVQGFM